MSSFKQKEDSQFLIPEEWTSEPIKVLEVFKDTLLAGTGSNILIWSLKHLLSDQVSNFSNRPQLIQAFSERCSITSLSCVDYEFRLQSHHNVIPTDDIIEVVVTTLYSYRKFTFNTVSKSVTFHGAELDAKYAEILVAHCFNISWGYLVYDTNNQVIVHEFEDESEVISTFRGNFGAPDAVKITGGSINDVLIFVSSSATINICTLKTSNRIVEVLLTLNQEKGVIFSLQFYPESKLIISTSDERCVALWKCNYKDDADKSSNFPFISSPKTVKVELQCLLEGHTARVFNCLQIGNGDIVSVGEDSNIVVWPLEDPNRYRVIGNHKGSTIWSCAYHKKSNVLFTGADDGSILNWNLSHLYGDNKMNECELYPFLQYTKEDFPRLVKCYDGSSVLVSTNSGILSLTSDEKVIHKNEDLIGSKYLTITISPDKSMYVIGTFEGSLFFYLFPKYKYYTALTSDDYVEQKLDVKTCLGPNLEKVMSIHFLDDSQLLVSTIMSLLLFQLIWEEDKNIKPLPEVVLKWTVKLKSSVNCVEKVGDLIYAGLHDGKIEVYNIHDGTKLHDFKIRHDKFGVGGIAEYRGQIVTGGRDSTLKFFCVDVDLTKRTGLDVMHLKTYPLPFLWVGCFTKYKDDLLVCGFESRDFVVFSLKREQIIGRVNCGGAHRSWDFSVVNGSEAIFTHVRSRKVYKYVFELDATGCIKEGFHLDDINSVIQIPLQSDTTVFLATAGEDCSVKFSSFNIESDNSAAKSTSFVKKLTQTIFNHTSAVRCLKYQSTKKNSEGYLISGGGKSELIFTKLYFHGEGLRKYENISKCTFEKEIDFRIMDIATVLSPVDQTNLKSEFVIPIVFAACSDGILRVVQPNKQLRQHKFQGLYRRLSGTQHCLTSVQFWYSSPSDINVVCGTSAGELVMWKLTPPSLYDVNVDIIPYRIFSMEVISITSLHIYVRREDDGILFIGGDDGSIRRICLTELSSESSDIDFSPITLANDGILGLHVFSRYCEENIYFVSGCKMYECSLDMQNIKYIDIPVQDTKGLIICRAVKQFCSSDIRFPIVSYGKESTEINYY